MSFPSTQWSMVVACCRRQTPQWQAQMDAFCRRYWQPVVRYIERAWGAEPDDAHDLAQEFFARLIERPLGQVAPGHGRFRAYLKQALKHFLLNHRRDASRLKRGGGAVGALPDDVPADGPTPDEVYDREWLLTLLARAIERLEDDCRRDGCEVHAQLFRAFDLAPPDERPSYDQLAERYGLSTNQVRNILYEMRKRLARTFRALVSELVIDPAELEAEVAALLG